jgi:predicted nuclease of restriction endonuclease-like (RecB) superfamily
MELQSNIVQDIRLLIDNARKSIVKSVNWAMVIAYWEIGKRIVEEEQNGEERAKYGSYLIKNLANQLTHEFGKGFDERELRKMRQFYHTFPIRDTLRPELSWSHYRLLMKIEDEQARKFYMSETVAGAWSTRQLDRQIVTAYYQRLLASKEPSIVQLHTHQENNIINSADFLKDPFVLEFLDIQTTNYLEYDLENAILNNLQQFLLELGKGFSFVARQQRITTDAGKHYKIDLVFYNYMLKCFVLIDLKIGTLTPQDVGQMDMYVRLYEQQKKPIGDNPTLGIILCSEKDDTVVQFSVLHNSEQLFASQYQLYLPTEKQLKEWVNKQRLFLDLKHNDNENNE